MKYIQRGPCDWYWEYLDRQKRRMRCFLSGIGIAVAGTLACLAINYAGNKENELRLEKPQSIQRIERILDDETLDRLEDNLEGKINEPSEKKEIPNGAYDIGTGYFDPKTNKIYSRDGEFIRDVCDEESEYLRKTFNTSIKQNSMKPAREYKISASGIGLVKEFEGFREQAYLCPADVWTIGYGYTDNVKEGDTITREKATEYLKADLEKAENAVRKNVQVPLTQNQYDALVSFTYNVGTGAFKKSTLLKRLNAGDYDGAGEQMIRWNKITDADGKRSIWQGLANRRAKEKEYFLGVEG